jgi:aminopeptidase-like protein
MYRHWLDGWAISLPHDVVQAMPEGQYGVDIDVAFTDEPMQVFEYVAQGQRAESVVLCGHIDHPGMINDSLSGCIASLQAVGELEKSQPHYTYRVWMLPEIIASAVHLDAHPDMRRDIRFALCSNMTAHDAPFAVCLSKSQTSLLDRAMRIAVAEGEEEYRIGAFHKYPDCGDEISFDTVGYNIPTTTLSRVGEMFKTYHTSVDSIDQFLLPDWQARHQSSVATLVRGLSHLDRNRSLIPRFAGNPCLSNPELDLYLQPSNVSNQKIKEGLRKTLDGGEIDLRNFMEFFLGALGQEGASLVEIADAANVDFEFVANYAERFRQKGLIAMNPVDRVHIRPVISTTSLARAQLI